MQRDKDCEQSSRLIAELKSFSGIWSGGYYEGDPLDPMGASGYRQLGFMSILHATYLRCIKPYVNGGTVAIEIGPGRGAWTKTLLPSKEVVALDALPAEYNGFFNYVGRHGHVRYFQVADFECDMLADDHFNYMFSFGCLCHVSFDGITRYAVNIYPKLKQGSNCFWMVADYDKYNTAVSNLNRFSPLALLPGERKYLPMKWILNALMKKEEKLQYRKKDENDNPSPGRWYHAGVERTCSMLRDVGYKIVDPDVGTCHRDPIIHFIKA